MKRPALFLIPLLVVFPIVAAAQTYTIAGGSPQSLQITGVKAGDQVTLDAALFSGDPNENGEGEPLVVNIPGGAFVVSAYFAPAQTTFLALQDNQVVSAFIQGFDGDESAQVTFTVNAKKRYTQEEKDKFAKYAAILGGVGGTLGTISAICGLTPEPTATKVCAIVGALGAGASAILAARYGLMALDPCDPNFATIFQPQLMTIPPILAQNGVTQAEADAANAWLLNLAQQAAWTNAITVSINRANCASTAGDTADEARQIQAAATYSAQLADFVSAAAGTRANLVAAIQAAGFTSITAGPGDVFNYEVNLLFFGLPTDTFNAAVALGADQNTINFITGLLMVQDINTTGGTFPDFLNNANTSSVEQLLAAALQQFAADNGGGVPLKAGQMVQAQGWLNGAGGKTTFSVEAHVNQQGDLLGKLQLSDHSGLSIQQGTVVHALLSTDATSFSVDGTFVASDGSTQTWTVKGNVNQSVAITTSQGFAVSGTLGGGNVTIKP